MERVLWRRGLTVVAGADEVGRGPLAGPVVAAAVVLPPDCHLPGVDDSKRLTEKQRQAAYPRILARALAWGVGVVAAEEIDRLNIRNAAFLAVRRALAALGPSWPPQFLLLDGNARLPDWPGPQRAVVGGDRKILSVAAASVIAKVTRDAMAREWEAQYPGYGFAAHKGYATPAHYEALARLGPCPLHRRSFLGPSQRRLAL